MPLLEEVLHTFGNSISYEIELKDYGKEFIETVLRILQEYKDIKEIELTSFQYPMLSYIKKQVPSHVIGLITQQIPDYMTKRQAQELVRSSLIEGILDVIHFPVKLYDKELIDTIHEMGVEAHGGLCKSEEELKTAIALGVDRISTYDVKFALNYTKN